jgi:hypothetical protein
MEELPVTIGVKPTDHDAVIAAPTAEMLARRDRSSAW